MMICLIFLTIDIGFNTTLSSTSAVWRRSVLMVREAVVPGERCRPCTGLKACMVAGRPNTSNALENRTIQPYSIEKDQTLRMELLDGYDPQQKPSLTVEIDVSLTILTINDMDIKQQILTLSGYFEVTWLDDRLSWSNASTTSQDYTYMHHTFIAEEYIWKPAMIIENSVKSLVLTPYDSAPLTIEQGGRVIWNTAGVYKVTCESDTKYYPMDSQTCYITISGWQYTVDDVRLYTAVIPIQSDHYSENGEWILLEIRAEDKEDKIIKSGRTFSSITFVVKLQRRLLFHILHTLLPVILMATLIPFVFKLPVDSGEKIGFSLTVLLSYAVYLTMIADNIPSTSVTPCLLSVYLVFVLFMATIAVCCSALVININMTNEDHIMPIKVKRLTTKYLMAIANLETCCSMKKNKVHEEDDSQVNQKKSSILTPVTNLTNDALDQGAHVTRDVTWKELATILDKVFFNVYMMILLSWTLILNICIIHGYIMA